LMWVVGTIYLWITATVVWFRWSARAERGDAEHAVPLEAYGNVQVVRHFQQRRGS